MSRDLQSGVTTVRTKGELTVASAAEFRAAIGKAAAECPAAVIVDLSELGRVERACISVFATVTHQAQETWGTPILLFAASPEIRRDLGAWRNFVALYDERWQAQTAVRAYAPRWRHLRLKPVPGSAAAARALVGDACLSWRLLHLRDNARLVVSELAANAIVHARTGFDVVTACTRCYLRIAVHDGSPTLPRVAESPPTSSTIMTAGSGRGLRIVVAVATHWGATSLPDGKIVWALLSTER